jgi:ATP-dependent DNA helicase RecG
VFEDAVGFGIAQLHQLRGRVGRGAAASWCYLLSEAVTPDAEERLSALERSADGFELAEVDLELRGEGAILGTRQKGVTDLKLASLRRDKELVGTARQTAFAIVDADPALAGHPLLADEVRLLVDDEDREFLFKS